jgi:hypothetical protein
MLIGTAVGMVAAIGATLVVNAHVRPDIVVALVLGVPSVIGLLVILCSTRRWTTALGAFLLAAAPGWFGMLAAIQVVYGA